MEVVLAAWGLSELFSVFEANDIRDIETLEDVLKSPEEVKRNVFRSLGLRLKLERKFKEHIKLQQNVVLDVIDTPRSRDDTDSEDTNRTLSRASTSEATVPQDVISVNEPRVLKRSRALQIDLKSILEEHPLGRAIILTYRHKQELTSVCQSYLCDIIVLHLLKIDNLRVTNDDFEQISFQIVELFPDECSLTYYVPPVRKRDSRADKSGVSKGRLVDKYRNKSTFIRAANNLMKESETLMLESQNREEIELAEKSKAWLVHNREAAGVATHWEISYSLRETDAANKKYLTLAGIFDNWPILKESRGYELIEKDFSKKYPEAADCFILKWEKIFDQVLALYRKNLSPKENLDAELLNSGSDLMLPDTRHLIQLELLSSLLAPKSHKVCINSKGKKTTAKSPRSFWKPTSVEAREGIAIHVKIPGDIEHEVDQKSKKMASLGLPLQPFVIAVGPKLEEITKVYVRVDATTYEVPSVLKGLDILMKLFITYNSQYPVESENIWYFVQWGICNIHTDADTHIPFIYNTLNKLHKRNK